MKFAPKTWNYYLLQEIESRELEALRELHDNVMFYLVIILFGLTWVMLSIIKYYVFDKSQINDKSKINDKNQLYDIYFYFFHRTDFDHDRFIKLLWKILISSFLILISFPCYKLLSSIDMVNVIDSSLIPRVPYEEVINVEYNFKLHDDPYCTSASGLGPDYHSGLDSGASNIDSGGFWYIYDLAQEMFNGFFSEIWEGMTKTFDFSQNNPTGFQRVAPNFYLERNKMPHQSVWFSDFSLLHPIKVELSLCWENLFMDQLVLIDLNDTSGNFLKGLLKEGEQKVVREVFWKGKRFTGVFAEAHPGGHPDYNGLYFRNEWFMWHDPYYALYTGGERMKIQSAFNFANQKWSLYGNVKRTWTVDILLNKIKL